MKALPRLLLALALTAGIVLPIAYREHLDSAALTAWVASAGAAGPLVFMAIYALATIVFLPGSLLTLAGGALFGPAWGTLYNLTAATLGAALAFLIARHLAADWVQTRSGGIGKRLVHGVEAEGWRFVAFTRLMPIFVPPRPVTTIARARCGRRPVSPSPSSNTAGASAQGHSSRHSTPSASKVRGAGARQTSSSAIPPSTEAVR